jgi:hypothetical protein
MTTLKAHRANGFSSVFSGLSRSFQAGSYLHIPVSENLIYLTGTGDAYRSFEGPLEPPTTSIQEMCVEPPTALPPWHVSTRFVGRGNLRSAPSSAKAKKGTAVLRE